MSTGSATLDRDVQQLERWLRRLADRQQASRAGVPLPASPGDDALPELTGPLKILLPRLNGLRARQWGSLAASQSANQLETLLAMTRGLEQRCERLSTAHARLRAVPSESESEESRIDSALLCQVEYDLQVAEATFEVFVLAQELGPRTAGMAKRLADQRRRAARLHLRRLDIIATPAAYPSGIVPRELLDEREMWTGVAQSGARVHRKQPSPQEVATEWLDKSADLVVLHLMIEDRGHADPFRWFREADVQPRPRRQPGLGRLEEIETWGQRLRWLQELGRRRLLFTAGSTHPGEDQLLADAFGEARGDRDDATLVLAPRHWERRGGQGTVLRDEVLRAAGGLGEVRLLSALRQGENPSAVIVPCTGMLRAIYGVGQGAFVGGTLCAAMGHNVCEPLVWGIPTWTGPNHHANILEWEEVQAAMDPHLRSVEASGLTAMFREWFHLVDTGAVERNRPTVRAALGAYLGGLAEQSLAKVGSIPPAIWRCAARVTSSGCPDCDGTPTACVHWADLQRYRMADEDRVRWFIPRFARFVLERMDERM
ncbi:3-deoxy-D-manno-octulosonic acid transferase [Paraliomyxa miuraensis]|uniref:3-deoxy-D-manno-octulosonic acid transferase n=1 Tax=Paraliomyxa miuraensis TaxID=376150 RepID=UPI002256E1E1|nr:hypothetical protein [Paraliomyxa miuraensis]MCX4243618.1 hypothetical protein [Paraliomyxa miuraensis]